MAFLRYMTDLYTSFQAGQRLIDGGELMTLASTLQSSAYGITAAAGGTQALAVQLEAYINRVETVASANDSVKLPQAVGGLSIIVINATGTSMQVFGQAANPATGAGDTIAANGASTQVATATGVAQAANTMMLYACSKPGEWKQGSMA